MALDCCFFINGDTVVATMMLWASYWLNLHFGVSTYVCMKSLANRWVNWRVCSMLFVHLCEQSKINNSVPFERVVYY